MKKAFPIIGIVVFILLAALLYKSVVNIKEEPKAQAVKTVETQKEETKKPVVNNKKTNPVPNSQAVGIELIKEIEAQTDKKSIKYGDYVYLGGPWGLLVGSKKNKDFQRNMTENPVREVTLDKKSLQYEELNSYDNTWEYKSVNLSAYEKFLDNQE